MMATGIQSHLPDLFAEDSGAAALCSRPLPGCGWPTAWLLPATFPFAPQVSKAFLPFKRLFKMIRLAPVTWANVGNEQKTVSPSLPRSQSDLTGRWAALLPRVLSVPPEPQHRMPVAPRRLLPGDRQGLGERGCLQILCRCPPSQSPRIPGLHPDSLLLLLIQEPAKRGKGRFVPAGI